MKSILPWILVLGLGVGLASVFVSSRAKDTEIAKLRAESQQAETLRAELETTRAQVKTTGDQLTALRSDQGELLRLRNEVGQLRGDRQQLSKQVQSALSQAELAKSQAAQAAQTGAARAQELARLQGEVALRKHAAEQDPNAQRDGCINNLRQIDAAKQQWGLENNKTAEAMPVATDILPYLKDKTAPICPAGGTYTINALNQVPTCSIPGHVLSTQ